LFGTFFSGPTTEIKNWGIRYGSEEERWEIKRTTERSRFRLHTSTGYLGIKTLTEFSPKKMVKIAKIVIIILTIITNRTYVTKLIQSDREDALSCHHGARLTWKLKTKFQIKNFFYIDFTQVHTITMQIKLQRNSIAMFQVL
jgi:hypothetical protein